MAFIQSFEKTAGFADIVGKGIEGVQSLLTPKGLPPVKRNPKSIALADKVFKRLHVKTAKALKAIGKHVLRNRKEYISGVGAVGSVAAGAMGVLNHRHKKEANVVSSVRRALGQKQSVKAQLHRIGQKLSSNVEKHLGSRNQKGLDRAGKHYYKLGKLRGQDV